MLAALGFITVILMLILIMTKRHPRWWRFIAVPVVTGIIACFFISVVPEGAPEGTAGVVDFVANFKSLGKMITGSSGIGSVAATGVMFIFSILFFGILTDAGTFRPIIGGITRMMGTDPREDRHRHRDPGHVRPSGRLRRRHLSHLCTPAGSPVRRGGHEAHHPGRHRGDGRRHHEHPPLGRPHHPRRHRPERGRGQRAVHAHPPPP